MEFADFEAFENNIVNLNQFEFLDYKSKINKNNDTYIDLMSDSFNMSSVAFDGQVIIVNKYYVARPDLVSLAIYGTDDYADIICKINGISNPFELNENDILFLPDIEFIRNCCKQSSSKSEIVETEDEILTPKKTNNFQKKKNERRSSNEQLEGEQNYVIDKSLGLVFY